MAERRENLRERQRQRHGLNLIRSARDILVTSPRICVSVWLSKTTAVRFGMSAAQVPLRAFKIHPAKFIGQIPKSSSPSRLPVNGPLRLLSLAEIRSSQPWSVQQNHSASFPALRPFSTSTPLSASTGAMQAKSLRKQKKQSKSESKSTSKPSQSGRNTIKYLVVAGVLGLGAVVFSDQLQHAYRAAERTGRVVGTLAVCINE